jgi:hypothetical protein
MSSITSPSPKRMMVPLPNCFSIWAECGLQGFGFFACCGDAFDVVHGNLL